LLIFLLTFKPETDTLVRQSFNIPRHQTISQANIKRMKSGYMHQDRGDIRENNLKFSNQQWRRRKSKTFI